MKLRTLSFIKNIFLLGILLLPSLTYADDENSSEAFACADAVNVMDCIEKTKQIASTHPIEPQAITVNTQQLGINGPASIGVRYDTELGWIPELSYTQIFYENGIYLQLGYGANEKRANVTLGHGFNPQNQIKFTYEYLSQNLPFDFASGNVNEWVSQNAFGAAYRFLFGYPVLRSFDLNGYYIKAGSKDLSDIIYYQNNEAYLNLRHIAGGTEETATASISLAPFHQTLISLGGGYSHLVYDTEYEDNQENAVFAFHAALEHLFTPWTKLSTSFDNSASEMDTRVKISQILPAHIEAAITGEYSQGQAGQPDSKTITASLSYPVTNYTVPPIDSLDALKTWIQKPVVHANRVLAIKDEAVKKFTITATNPNPQTIKTGTLIAPVYTQEIFSFDPSMYDRIDYSINTTALGDANKVYDSASQLNIAIQSNNGSVYNSIIYSTAPMPNSAITTDDPSKYMITITANGYKSGLAAPITAVAQLEIDVTYNSSNEPQWDPNKVKTGGAINLDVTEIPNSINLNAYIQSSTNTTPLKFTLQNPSDPNWNIKVDNNGLSYLVRKAGANNTFDAAFIGAQTAKLIVKYVNDPDSIPGTATDLPVTVKAATDITFQWNTSCVINTLTPTQPSSTITPQVLTLLGTTNPCVMYLQNSSTPITILNDQISFTAKTSYHAGVTINNNQLTINNALPNDMGQTFGLTLSTTSKAAGQSDVKAADIVVNASINIIGTSSNEEKVGGSYGYDYAILTITNLDPNTTYTIVDGSADVSNPDVSLGDTNPYVCPGKEQDPDNDTQCVKYKDAGKLLTSGGTASIIWKYSYTDPQQVPSYINKISIH